MNRNEIFVRTDPIWDASRNLLEAINYSRSVYGVFGPVDAPKLGPERKPEPEVCECCGAVNEP